MEGGKGAPQTEVLLGQGPAELSILSEDVSSVWCGWNLEWDGAGGRGTLLKPHPLLDFPLNQSSEAVLINFRYHSEKGLFNEQFSSVLLTTS